MQLECYNYDENITYTHIKDYDGMLFDPISHKYFLNKSAVLNYYYDQSEEYLQTYGKEIPLPEHLYKAYLVCGIDEFVNHNIHEIIIGLEKDW